VNAVVVLHEDAAAIGAEILGWCRDRTAGYKWPGAVSFMRDSEIRRTATGKIQRRLRRDKMIGARSSIR